MSIPTDRTNLGPLTATFSAPSSCSVIDGSFTKTGGGLNGALAYSCSPRKGNGQVFGADPACLPNSLAEYISGNDKWLYTIAVYSPGNICPNGYSSACTVTRSANDEPPTTGTVFQTASRAMYNILEIGETAIGCCPSGYTCAEDDIYKCYTPGTVGQVLTGIIRETSCTPMTTTFTIQSLSETSSIANGRRLIMIQGSPNGEADKTSSTSKRGSSSSSVSKPTSSQGAGVGGSNPENTPGASGSEGASSGSNNGGGLTTGAKIAIGVTIPVVALLASLAIFMLCFIRKKRRSKAENEKAAMMAAGVPGPPPPPSGPQELAGTAGYAYQQQGQEPYIKSELMGQPLSEAPGQTVYDQTSELQGNSQQLGWNQTAPAQQPPVPEYSELPVKSPSMAVGDSNAHPKSDPADSSPAKTVSQKPAGGDNEPWKWNEPLYPEKQ